MKLYHGTNTDFNVINLEKSRPNKDFGKGFYLSDNYEQAQKMAEFKVLQSGGNAIVQTYDFDEKSLKDTNLRVKEFTDYSIEWAEFVISNRNNQGAKPTHDYDIVIGPIANDKVGVQIRKFIDNEIDIKTFMSRLKYMKGITIQYFFGTKNSLKTLHRHE